jgi:hypothetical protein
MASWLIMPGADGMQSKMVFLWVRDPERERSNAFHWAQSIQRHIWDYIKDGRQDEHVAMWKKLQDAQNIVKAYHLLQDIAAWWRQGNAHADKLKELDGRMAWWVVTWTQWGNSIQVVRILRIPLCLLFPLLLGI